MEHQSDDVEDDHISPAPSIKDKESSMQVENHQNNNDACGSLISDIIMEPSQDADSNMDQKEECVSPMLKEKAKRIIISNQTKSTTIIEPRYRSQRIKNRKSKLLTSSEDEVAISSEQPSVTKCTTDSSPTRRNSTKNDLSQKRRRGRPPKTVFQNSIVSSGLIECAICAAEYSDLTALRLHVKITHENDSKYRDYIERLGGYVYENAIECQICNAIFTRKELLKQHVRAEHFKDELYVNYLKELGCKPCYWKKNVTCELCSEKVVDIQELLKHVTKTHGEEEEGREYGERLDEDMKRSCAVCAKVFVDRQKYKQHVINVHPVDEGEQRLHVCKHCKKQFKTSNNLHSHINKIHDKQNRSVMCHKCSKTYSNIYNLRDHIRQIHEKQTRSKCPMCDAVLVNLQGLRRHIICVHENRRPHLCQHCGKTFSVRADLKTHVSIVHMYSSEEKKPHVCQFCNRRFSNWRNHRKHENNIHRKIFPFNCRVCDQSFAQGKPFRRHVERKHPSLADLAEKKLIKNIEYSDLNLVEPTPEEKEQETDSKQLAEVLRPKTLEECAIQAGIKEDVLPKPSRTVVMYQQDGGSFQLSPPSTLLQPPNLLLLPAWENGQTVTENKAILLNNGSVLQQVTNRTPQQQSFVQIQPGHLNSSNPSVLNSNPSPVRLQHLPERQILSGSQHALLGNQEQLVGNQATLDANEHESQPSLMDGNVSWRNNTFT